jgi:hypothetical protein
MTDCPPGIYPATPVTQGRLAEDFPALMAHRVKVVR